jgi:hypothetical protein
MARRRSNNRSAEPSNFWNTLIFRFGAKLLFASVVVVVILTLSQCTVKKPEAPTWETQLTVPLINRTYPMEELIRRADQDGITMVGDTIQYAITYDLDTFRLDQDNLTTSDLTYGFSAQLGTIDLDAPTVAPMSAAASSITGLATFVPGNVPATAFTLSNDVPTITSFGSVSVHDGHLYAVVTNSLGIVLDTVRVILYDVARSYPIDTGFITGGLNDGETDSALISLDGKTISNDLRVDIRCHTPGGSVLSASGKELATAVHFSDPFSADQAMAQVPALSRTDSQVVSVAESDVIDQAVISEGTLTITIANGTSLPAEVDVTIPELNQAGIPLSLTRTVPADGSTPITVDLAGYRLEPNGSTAPQTIAVVASLSSDGSGANQVPVDQSDAIAVDASLSGLTFSSVTGTFANTSSTFDPVIEDIDIPQGFEGIHLSHVVLNLEITNGVSLPGQISVQLNGNNGRTLTLDDAVSPATLSTATTTVLVDTTAATFLDPIPSQISASGEAQFGDGVTPGTIRAGDFVTGRVQLIAPMEMIIDETPIETDISSETIDQDNIDQITDHVLEAAFIYNVISRLPLGATMNIYLSGDSATLYSNPQLVIDGILVPAAPTVGGVASDTVSTGFQSVVLDSTDIQILKNPVLFVGQELVLNGSNGQVIRLTPNDAITFTGRIEVKYRFDGEF